MSHACFLVSSFIGHSSVYVVRFTNCHCDAPFRATRTFPTHIRFFLHTTMDKNLSTTVKEAPAQQQLCSNCKTLGHDSQSCPHKSATTTTTHVTEEDDHPTDQDNGLPTRALPLPLQVTHHKVHHVMVKITGAVRQRCSYCALSGKQSRTRFKCDGCGVPFCSIGSGKTARDCFALAHGDEDVRELCLQKHAEQQKHTTKKSRPDVNKEQNNSTDV